MKLKIEDFKSFDDYYIILKMREDLESGGVITGGKRSCRRKSYGRIKGRGPKSNRKKSNRKRITGKYKF